MTAGVRAVATLIGREGPIPFDRYMELALYGDGGFFTRGAGAGRAGRHFVTSPEVGPLFGRLVASALDGWWFELGSPDPFAVVEAGAGRGQLARSVLRAEPRCAKALRYLLVEVSDSLRGAQREHLSIEPAEGVLGPLRARDGDGDDVPAEPLPGAGPIVGSLAELPASPITGVVVANELLDNLPFRIVERTSEGWAEVLVGVGESGELLDVLVPADSWLAGEMDDAAPDVPAGCRMPAQVGVDRWMRACSATLRAGFVVLVDYMASPEELVARGEDGWLRTYREHARGDHPLHDPGSQDITADVSLAWLRRAARRAGLTVVSEQSQRDWLVGCGIDALVEQARATWSERAHLGDLVAIEARSAISEASALTDPGGLGAHRVLVLQR